MASLHSLFTFFFFFLLIPVFSNSLLDHRSPDILSEINTITTQCEVINSTLTNFTPTTNVTLTALELQSQSSTLLSDINSATTVAQSTSPLNEQDSATIAQAVVVLSTVVYDLLDRFVAKKPVFDKAIFGVASASSLVKLDLQNLRTATGAFGNATTTKLVGTIQKLAPLVTSDIDFHFVRAVQVYSS